MGDAAQGSAVYTAMHHSSPFPSPAPAQWSEIHGNKARLSLALLGSFQVTRDGHPVTTFELNKVHALLAYLAVEVGRNHARAFLAELLWPDLPAATALTYLRNVLANLKQAIPDATPAGQPFLLGTCEAVALNPSWP